MSAKVTTVVGIDLSGVSRSTKGRTAGARLRLEPRPVLEDLRTFPAGVGADRTLVAWVVDSEPTVVAVDAPLSLPHSVVCATRHCTRCVPGEGEYLARDIDRMVDGMPTVMLAAIAFRGMHLARLLRDRGLTVIETYPRAAYRCWAPEGTPRADILAPRVAGFRGGSVDECDAVAAALVARAHAGGHATSFEDVDGAIWAPAAD